MTKPPLTAEERNRWFEQQGQINEEFPSTPEESLALKDYLDGQIPAREACLRLFDCRETHQGRATIEGKSWRVSGLIGEAVLDIREQQGELLELVDVISTTPPEEFRLGPGDRESYPDFVNWPKTGIASFKLGELARLYDIDQERYAFGVFPDDEDTEEHPLYAARRYVSLAEWYAREYAVDGEKYRVLEPMQLALESELITEEWPNMDYKGQDPDDPYTAYDVEIPMVSAWLRHSAQLMFTAPGVYADEKRPSWRGEPEKVGTMWHGRPGFSFERWTFWKQRLRWMMESEECPAKSDTRDCARFALARMKEVEREQMTQAHVPETEG